MGIVATYGIRTMRGSSQPKLMMSADNNLWVVKFQNNPQDLHVLANEWIVSLLARAIGLSVPQPEVIEVSPSLAANDPNLNFELNRGRRELCLPGRHFASSFVGGLTPGNVVDYLPQPLLAKVKNLDEFAGILALDKWTCNCDGRQAVFTTDSESSPYRAAFIDHGFCFNVGEWDFPDAPLRGTYLRKSVYEKVTGWESFSPWLERIEQMDPETVFRITRSVPPEWYRGGNDAIEQLTARILDRRSRVRELIQAFRVSSDNAFPLWFSRTFPGSHSMRAATRRVFA